MDSFLHVIHGPMELFFEKSGSCVKKAVSENGKICEHNIFNEKNSKENQKKYNGWICSDGSGEVIFKNCDKFGRRSIRLNFVA